MKGSFITYSLFALVALLEFSRALVVHRSWSMRTTPAARLPLVILHNSNNKNDNGDGKGGFFKGISNFFEELDAFMDDASARRLGNGAAFYGKRKSNFYGSDDKQRKANRNAPDPMEVYQGPTNTGLFVWMQDEETGQMKPVTRMKNKVIERSPKFWDRFYDSDTKQ